MNWKEPFGMSWADVGIIISGFAVVSAAINQTFATWWTKRKESIALKDGKKKLDSEAYKTDAETSNAYAETSSSFAKAAAESADLYRGALEDVAQSKIDIRKLEGSQNGLKNEISMLKDIIELKDRDYLSLKQQIASQNQTIEELQVSLQNKNSQIESKNQLIETKNRLIENHQVKIDGYELEHRRMLVGIEILLGQMNQAELIPLWYPTKKE